MDAKHKSSEIKKKVDELVDLSVCVRELSVIFVD